MRTQRGSTVAARGSGRGVGFFRLLAISLIVIAMACAVLVIVQRVFNPFQGVASDSMSPSIKTGDAVVITDGDPSAVKVGQVIVFQDPETRGQFVIHRVVGIDETGPTRYFITTGDNNPVTDDWRIAPGAVVGQLGMRLPGFGRVLSFLFTARGYFTCICGPVALSLLLVVALSMFESSTGVDRRGAFRPART